MSSGKKPSDADAADVISSLKEAEERSVRDAEEARAAKDERIRKAGGKADAIGEKALAEAEALKAKLISDAKSKISIEEHAIISKAKKDAEAVRKKKVPKKAAEAALAKLVRELND